MFIFKFLRPQLLSIIVASMMSLMLGAVSALIGIVIGPTMQLFMRQDQTGNTALADLLGARLASLITNASGIYEVSVDWLWMVLPIGLLAMALTRAVLSVGQWFLWERAGELMSRRWRDYLVDHYLFLDPEARRSNQGRHWEAELASVLTNDLRVVREYVVRVYGALPREICQVAFLIASLIMLSPKMFAIFVFAVGPAIWVATRLGKKLRRRSAAALKDFSELTEWIQQRLLGIETIKQSRTEELEIAAMQTLNKNLLQRFLRALRVKSLTSPVLEACAVASIALVLAMALNEVIAGDVSGGVQLSFFSSLALLAQAADRCGRYLNASREGSAALERLQMTQQFLDKETKPRISPWQLEQRPHVLELQINDLSVKYEDRTNDALSKVSLTLHGGRFYCVCGPSGAGKSTLMKVMLGLVKPTTGSLKLISEHSNQQMLGYLPQQFQLMSESIAANIAYPDQNIDAAKVRKALAQVGMLDFVDALPAKADEVVGPGGRALSGGQAQKLQVARIIYHQYPVVLVDEGTSALDPVSEQQILQLIKNLARANCIVVMIAHRPAVAAYADEIVLFEQGRLVLQEASTTAFKDARYQRLMTSH